MNNQRALYDPPFPSSRRLKGSDDVPSERDDDRMPTLYAAPALAPRELAPTELPSSSLEDAAFLLFCILTALQPTFNSAAVGDYFSTGIKQDVSEPEKYMTLNGHPPGLNFTFGFFGLFANAMITYVFFPATVQKLKQLWQEPNTSSKSIGGAIIFGCAAAAVAFKLSADSFALGENKGAWQVLNYSLIAFSIAPTFCSRFKGSYAMLDASWRIRPLALTLGSYFYLTDKPLSWAIVAQNDLLRSVYTLSSADLGEMTAKMQAKEWGDALDYFYKGTETDNGWQGPHVSYLRSAVYWSLQVVFAAISIAASFIVFNIDYSLASQILPPNSEIKWWITGASTLIVTLPATLYYIYSLSALPDKGFRTLMLAHQVSDTGVWLQLAALYIVALGSCGNLLYAGMSQGLRGDFAWTGYSSADAQVFAGFFGGAISALCNLFALLDIFERKIKTHFNLADSVTAYEDAVNDFMHIARNELRAHPQPEKESVDIAVDGDIRNPLINNSVSDVETADQNAEPGISITDVVYKVRDFYAQSSFFRQQLSSNERRDNDCCPLLS